MLWEAKGEKDIWSAVQATFMFRIRLYQIKILEYQPQEGEGYLNTGHYPFSFLLR